MDDKKLLESYIGLLLKVVPIKDNYKPGDSLKIEACSSCLDLNGMTFAWWVYRDNEVVGKTGYQDNRIFDLILPSAGRDVAVTGNTYVVRCYIKNKAGKVFFKNRENIVMKP